MALFRKRLKLCKNLQEVVEVAGQYCDLEDVKMTKYAKATLFNFITTRT